MLQDVTHVQLAHISLLLVHYFVPYVLLAPIQHLLQLLLR